MAPDPAARFGGRVELALSRAHAGAARPRGRPDDARDGLEARKQEQRRSGQRRAVRVGAASEEARHRRLHLLEGAIPTKAAPSGRTDRCARSQRRDETLVKMPGEIDGQPFIIEECERCAQPRNMHRAVAAHLGARPRRCDILLLDNNAQVTIDECFDCRIFVGPCEASVFVRDSKRLDLIVACHQFRTRTCVDITALLHCTSQPSVEDTKHARLGCFSFFYNDLTPQLLRAKLSPFNNNWRAATTRRDRIRGAAPAATRTRSGRTALATPRAGVGRTISRRTRARSSCCRRTCRTPTCCRRSRLSHVRAAPVQPAEVASLTRRRRSVADLIEARLEPSVADLCPVPRSLGLHSAEAQSHEHGLLLVLPRAVPYAARWLRAITAIVGDDGAPQCALLVSREHAHVSADWAARLFSHSAGGRRLAEAAGRGRIIGFEFAGLDCVVRRDRAPR